ncbi:MAG: hypothetical protein H6713_39375 [Myxococcales bacterium]|nr:hypothetical protein [Myxococcales bacterium]
MRSSVARLTASLALALACDAGDGTSTDGDGTDSDEPWAEPAVPDEPEALHEWALSGAYLEWSAWSEVQPTGGIGGARVFLSPTLVASIEAGDRQHPIGATAVRELYDADLETQTGFAVITRVSDEASADAWLWLEVFSADPEAVPATAERGAPGCVGCHQQAIDFIQSTLPLP